MNRQSVVNRSCIEVTFLFTKNTPDIKVSFGVELFLKSIHFRAHAVLMGDTRCKKKKNFIPMAASRLPKDSTYLQGKLRAFYP
jgi:hypothetical protein